MANILQRIAGTLRNAARRRALTPAARVQRQVPTESRGRRLEYTPNLDGDADPGEIVWTWVRYEDDPHRGKDRPVLVVGRDDRTLLGLMLSSQSERDGQRNWLALGPGDWDHEHRPSWVRLDRILEVDQDGIRPGRLGPRPCPLREGRRCPTVAVRLGLTGYLSLVLRIA